MSDDLKEKIRKISEVIDILKLLAEDLKEACMQNLRLHLFLRGTRI